MAQRLFIGVGLDRELQAALSKALAAQPDLPPVKGLRWLAPESWHFTLQFLGSVEDERVPELEHACARAAAASDAFELALGEAGAFSSPRSATTLWIGLSEGAEPLAALCDAVHAETAALGFAREARDFTPHLTLARIKPPARVKALLAALRLPPLRTRVEALTLFRSEGSSRYTVLSPFALRAAKRAP